MGINGHGGHLVGKFASGVHVFQSVLVARTLGVRGSTFFLVLAADPWAANDEPMDRAGINQRVDDERLLSKCDDPGGANTGSAGELPRSVHAGKGRQSTIRRAIRLSRIVLHGRGARNVTYVHLAIYGVRRVT